MRTRVPPDSGRRALPPLHHHMDCPTCPVCRAECTAPARRCFNDAECPVCLTSTSTPYVLSCGHAVCLNDLTQLKIPVERPDKRRRFSKTLGELARKGAPLLVLAFAVWDPGAPAQWLFTAAGMLSGQFDSLCADPCYGHTETERHACDSDCECDGARTCSFFAFCVGQSGECSPPAQQGPPQIAWALQASVPRGSAGPHVPEQWSYRVNSSAFNSTSTNFTLLGVSDLSLQLRVWDTVGGGLALVRVGGPAGYYGRIEVRCDGHTYQLPHAAPLTGRDDWFPTSDGGVRFEAPSDLMACATGTLAVSGCSGFSLDVIFSELRYVPTFSMSGGEDVVLRAGPRWKPIWLPSRWLLEPGWLFGDAGPKILWSSTVRRGSYVTAPFDIAGSGRFALRVYPAGSHDAPPGRCSLLLMGPHGVKLTFVLRVRDKLFGTLELPLSCTDAGAGCWLKDAGEIAFVSERGTLGIVAVSFVSLEHRHSGDRRSML